MEDSLASLHSKLDSFGAQLAKIDVLEQTISNLVQENIACRDEIRKKDIVIDQLSEKVNRLDQSLRASSLRIHGLPVSTSTPTSEVSNVVLKEIVMPVIEAAKTSGDLPGDYTPALYTTIANAFAIPSKKNSSSSPVVVKLYSEHLRSLIFKHKKSALPTAPDPQSNRIRQKYAIYEDLTPANHSLLRTFADDSRVKSAWSFGGQIRFKTHHDETIHKVTSLSASYDSIIKPLSTSSSAPSPTTATASNLNTTSFATRQQMRDRLLPFTET
jgi:hypothetical protein